MTAVEQHHRQHPGTATVVLEMQGLKWATQKGTVEAVLGHRPAVVDVEANPVAQTATVTFDTGATPVAELRGWVEECGYHCAGQSVPGHICDPLAEPAGVEAHEGHVHAEHAPAPPAGHEEALPSPHDVMGHGGHGGMSMEAMVADMRNRFLVALFFSIPILLWSPIGREVMAGSSFLVAVNALLLKRLRLPQLDGRPMSQPGL
jgi:Cu2+-exporting ATPase